MITGYPWYDQIEPEIRSVVILLRNNGWNTVCSCGHRMYVDISLQNMDQIEELATFLKGNGYDDIVIQGELHTGDGLWNRRCTVYMTMNAFLNRHSGSIF